MTCSFVYLVCALCVLRRRYEDDDDDFLLEESSDEEFLPSRFGRGSFFLRLRVCLFVLV